MNLLTSAESLRAQRCFMSAARSLPPCKLNAQAAFRTKRKKFKAFFFEVHSPHSHSFTLRNPFNSSLTALDSSRLAKACLEFCTQALSVLTKLHLPSDHSYCQSVEASSRAFQFVLIGPRGLRCTAGTGLLRRTEWTCRTRHIKRRLRMTL